MDERIARQLVALNREFYRSFARPFAESRIEPQPGFAMLVDKLPDGPHQVLDVGCGDGRFGRFLRLRGVQISYTGLDLTPELLEYARTADDDVLISGDISQPGCLDGLSTFSCIVCLSTLQHIPGHSNRVRLLTEMRDHLKPDGLIMLGNWQFLDSPRQHRKLRDWSLVGIDPDSVGSEDYLLTWNRGGSGLRYAAHLDAAMIERLVTDAGLHLLDSFRNDGREGNLNLYSIVGS